MIAERDELQSRLKRMEETFSLHLTSGNVDEAKARLVEDHQRLKDNFEVQYLCACAAHYFIL